MIVPEHLLDLADVEIGAVAGGAPRQTNLCRAVSSAYYALFHHLLWKVATTFVPASQWKSRVLFLRSLDHAATSKRCARLGRSPLAKEERDFFGFEAFPPQLCDFANVFVRLQELRHSADYDPEFKISKSDAQGVVDSARQAIVKLSGLDDPQLTPFLAYLLCGPRR